MTPDQFSIAACCASCQHSRGYEEVEWCVKYRTPIYPYHFCSGIDLRPELSSPMSLQCDASAIRSSLRRWHSEELLWTLDEVSEQLGWLLGENENDMTPPSQATVDVVIELLSSVSAILYEGHISSAGAGDARVEWHTEDKRVTLSVSPSQSYIYHECDDVYDTTDATSENLRQWLTWLRGEA